MVGANAKSVTVKTRFETNKYEYNLGWHFWKVEDFMYKQDKIKGGNLLMMSDLLQSDISLVESHLP